MTDVEAHGKAILTRFDVGLASTAATSSTGSGTCEPRGAIRRPAARCDSRSADRTGRRCSTAPRRSRSCGRRRSPTIPTSASSGRTRSIRTWTRREWSSSSRTAASRAADWERSCSTRASSGLGNYLRSEIRWWAGLHPSWRPRDLDDEDRADLARWILDVTRQSYRTGGITDCLVRVAEAKAAGVPRRASTAMRPSRARQGCLPECGRAIDKIEVGNERLYLCVRCQPARRAPVADRASCAGARRGPSARTGASPWTAACVFIPKGGMPTVEAGGADRATQRACATMDRTWARECQTMSPPGARRPMPRARSRPRSARGASRGQPQRTHPRRPGGTPKKSSCSRRVR